MSKKILIAVFLMASFMVAPMAHAQEDAYNSSGLKIPRFVSLKKNKVFARTGPALRYPKKWVYKRNGLPVEIIKEFDTWRQIKDIDGGVGWVHQSLISGRRTGIVTQEKGAMLYKKAESISKHLALLENSTVVRLESCGTEWCKAEIQGFSGFLQRNSIWGVYEDEKFD